MTDSSTDEATEPAETSEEATAQLEPVTEAAESVPAPAEEPPAAPANPLAELEGEQSSGRGRKVLTAAGVVLVLLGGAYVGGVFYTADRTPPTATIQGVDVGGMTSEDAVAALDSGLADRVAAPVSFRVNDIEATLDPVRAGLAVDDQASVAQLTGRSWDPRVVINRLFGSAEVEAVRTVDETVLTDALSGAASLVEVPPVDATIVFASGEAVVTDPVDGSGLDVPGAVELIGEQWLRTEEVLDLPVVAVAPELGQDAVDAAMSDIVQPLLSAPVTLQIADQVTTLDPTTLTQVSSLVGVDGVFELQMDPTALAGVVSTALPEVGGQAHDASFQFVDGVPTVVPSVDGTGIDGAQLAEVVSAAALEPTGRIAVGELVTTAAEFTTADAEALGPLQVVSEFSTPMPYDPTRTENLVIGTSRVNGTVIMPGETFSLLATVGPISVANGYNISHGVDNGLVVDVAGGGLSQLSTTTFNAAFEAGMVDVHHRPHTRWFDRYPAGREATVDDPTLDMQWRNNTPYPILMQAGVANSRTWVKLWSLPYWDVEIVSGAKYNFTASKTIYNTKDNCQAESGGTQGFSINVTRTVSKDGVVDDEASEQLSWTYSAWPKVVCGPDPATQPQPTPAPTSGG